MRVVEVEENHDNEHRETTATNTNYNYRESLLSSITDMELPVLSFFDVPYSAGELDQAEQ